MLPELHAERQLGAIEAAMTPHMDKDDYRETMRRYRAATPKQGGRTLGEALSAVPMKVVEVPKEN